jgi:hypothetical protein
MWGDEYKATASIDGASEICRGQEARDEIAVRQRQSRLVKADKSITSSELAKRQRSPAERVFRT